MAGAARTVTVAVLGDTAQLERAFVRAGLVVEDTSKKIQGSAAAAGRAAAEQAKQMGLSATEQEAAAGRAAAAWTEASAKITASQRAAGEAAARSAKATGAALDEQRAAYSRAVASQREYEASAARASKAQDEAAAHAKKSGEAIASAGKWAALGFIGAGAGATKLAMNFQTATASIAANAGITQKAADGIGRAFLSTAGHTIFSATAMSTAFASVAGQLKLTEGHALSEAEALKVMSAAGNLAEATHASLTTTTAALSQTMLAYHLSVGQAASTSDILFNVSKSLNVPIDGVTTALSRLHSRLGSLAPSLRDTSTLMVELGSHGITGTRGIMVVNTALQTLVGGSKKTTDVLKAMGVNVFDASGHFVGLQSVIAQMAPKFAQMTQQQQVFAAQQVFGKGAAQAMLQVIQGGIPAYNQAAQAATRLGTAHQAATLQGRTLHDQMETLKATVTDLGTKFGLWLVPKLESVAQALSTGINWLEKHKAAAQALAAVIGGVLSVAIGTFAYTKAAAFITAVGEMGASLLGLGATSKVAAVEVDTAIGSTGIGLVIVGVGVAVMALATHWQQAMNSMRAAVEAMANGAISVLNSLISVFNSTIGQLTGGISQIGNVSLGGGGNGLSPSITPTAGGLGAPLGSGIHATRGPGGAVRLPSGGSNWQQIAGALAGQGFSSVAIAGILGNFAQETGGGSLGSINTRDSGSGASGMGGMGIAQWTAGRRVAEMGYAKAHGESSTSLAAQVGYLVQELRTNYHGAFTGIQHAGNPKAAAAIFNQLFEGGTDPNGVREKAAQQAYALLTAGYHAGGGGYVGGSGGGGGGNSGIAGLMNATARGKTKAAKAIRSLLYANPLAGDQYSIERTDQGKDFGNIHGNIGAIGAGVITLAQSLSGFGQTIVEKLTAGPNKGRSIYLGMETGAAGVGIHSGERVRAGQAIARGLGTGGIEMGFWNPATGRSEGAPYFNGSNATPPGTAFASWMAQLSHGGTYTTTKGGITTGGGANVGYSIANAVQQFITGLQKAANALIQTYQSLEQSGTVKTLSKALGVSTAGRVGGRLRTTAEAISTGSILSELNAGQDPTAIDGAGPKNTAGFSKELTAQIGRIHGAALDQLDRLLGEKHGTKLDVLVSKLAEIHGKALTRIEGRLHDSHSKPMRQLGKDLTAGPGTLPSITSILTKASAGSGAEKAYESQVASLIAAGQVRLAERLVAAHKAAMATLAQEIYAQQVTKDGELLNLQATMVKDQTTLMQNTDADLLNIAKAQQQAVDDAAASQVTAIQDMTTFIQDKFSGIVQAIQDATTAMADASGAVVEGIQDSTTIKVDLLGERGLYGLNLIAQKEQVQLDILKQGFDQQIQAAKANVDAVTSGVHVAEGQAQLALDQTTIAEHQLVAQAQSADDAVKIAAAVKIAGAQARVDALTLHEDAVVGVAQIGVDLGATLPKAQQDVLAGVLRKAQGDAAKAEANAGKTYASTVDAANRSVQAADSNLSNVTDTANNMIAAAQQTVAQVTGAGNAAIANAQQYLQGVQDTAAQQEAVIQGQIDITKGEASTQYAGSGLSVNIYGMNSTDSAAIASELSWVLRTAIPA